MFDAIPKQKMLPFFDAPKLQSPEEALSVLNRDLGQDGVEVLFMLMAKQCGYTISSATIKGNPYLKNVVNGKMSLFPVERVGLVCRECDTLEVLMKVKGDLLSG